MILNRHTRPGFTLLEVLVAEVSKAGLEPENVMVVFVETTFENWSFGGGRLIHA